MLRSALSFCLVLALAATATAATLVVHQDGTGDYTTILAAVSAAAPGDLIQVGPGTYPEYLVLTSDVTLTSEAGAAATILDGEMSHGLMLIDGVCSVDITGFAFTRAVVGGSHHGSAILAWHGPTVHVQDCVFTDNSAGWDNGAVHARHTGTTVTLDNCRFERNFANHNGGACGAGTYAALSISNSVFVDNWTDGIAGACNAYDHGNLDLTGCLFLDNSAGTGAIIVENSAGDIENCTFHANSSPDHASVLFYMATAATFSHNIVTSDIGGGGLEFLGCSGSHTCNIYYGNDAGAVLGEELEATESIVDPQFCDWSADIYTLCATSPAAPQNSPCGLVGAYGVACDICGPIATEATTWGGVKALYQ